MAELVRDHALQLVAVEPVQRATGHRHGRVGRAVTGGEGVDPGLLFQHEQLGHRHPGGDRDLLDHVAQPSQGGIAGILGHEAAAHLRGHHRPAPTQRGDPVQRAQADHRQGGHGHERDRTPVAGEHQRGQVDRQHDPGHGQREQQHQPARAAPCRRLLLEEVHLRRPARQNCTFGASRTWALSAGMSSSAAGAKLNAPATTLEGNTSRLLL